jgi:PAS domain-containing protein
LHAVIGIDLACHTTIRIGDGFIGRIAAEKHPVMLHHAAADPLVLHPAVKASGMRAAYGVPLTEEGSVIGVAVIGSRTAWELSHAARGVFDVVARRSAAVISYWKVREAFDREKAQLGALVAQLPAGVVVAEAPSGKLTLHNPQVELIWRRRFIASEFIEQYDAWPGHRANGQRIAPDEWPLTRALRNGETTLNEEVEILRGDGTAGAILLSAAPMRGPDGDVIGGVATMTDITQQRITEQQLKLAVEQAHRAATFQEIVSEASARLAESVEIRATAISIVRLGLPEIADSCAVYELVEDGTLRGVEYATVDPAKTARLRKRLSPSPTVVPGRLLREVLEDGSPASSPS